MKIYKNTAFTKWALDSSITDDYLKTAINEMNQGQFEANLGGNVYKKRIAFNNKGKRGGFRTIIAFKVQDKAFFVYGFFKNKQDNINNKELKALKKLAYIYLNLHDDELKQAIKTGELSKVE